MDDCDELPFVIDKTGTPVGVERRRSTVFVRNLPFDFTDDQLQRKFEEIGPVKRAFIVTGKANVGSKGFGFVIYADDADAQDAIAQLHNIDMNGRKIKVELARAPGDTSAPAPRRRPPVRRRQFSKKKATPGLENVVILEGVDSALTPKVLETKSRKFGPVSVFDFPAAESTPACRVARITFASALAARNAVRRLDKKALGVAESAPIRAGWADGKCARVILRNIPFNCKEPRLRLAMKTIGKVTDVHLPLDADKGVDCSKGFCFVQFDRFEDAVKAVTLGSVQIGGRTVAIDWALSKTHYLSHQDADAEPDSDSDSNGRLTECASNSGEDDNDAAICENDDDDAADENDDEVADENEDDAHTKMQECSAAQQDSSAPRPSRDVQEQRSVFVRNLPFDADADQLTAVFSRFGRVKSAFIVMDKEMNRPKGTAFIQFADAAGAAEAVKRAAVGWTQARNRADKTRRIKMASDQGVLMGGRTLDIALAVDRTQATDLQNENALKKKVDRKQAHLAKEGLINKESPAAKGLNKIELAMRAKLYKETTKKMTNPNYVMSPVRLSVHNLPDGVDDKRVRAVFLKAATAASAPGSKPFIKQCIVVRDKTALDDAGKPRSLRYGFVEFTEHEHALASLHALNNKPNGFGPNTHRLIVMFAVEDMRKMALRKARLKKSQQKMQLLRLQKELNLPAPRVGGKRARDPNHKRAASKTPSSTMPAKQRQKRAIQ